MNRETLKSQLIRHEGKKLVVYADSEGYATGGVGHLITPDDKLNLGDPITEAQCNAWLERDIDTAIAGVRHILNGVFDVLPEAAQLVLCDMCFNLGRAGLEGFPRFLGYIKARRFHDAGLELEDSKWWGQVGTRGPDLQNMLFSLEDTINA